MRVELSDFDMRQKANNMCNLVLLISDKFIYYIS